MGSNSKDKKKPKILYTVALYLIYIQQPTKHRHQYWRRVGRGGKTIGELGGGCKSIVLAAIEWGVYIKTKINHRVFKLIFLSAR